MGKEIVRFHAVYWPAFLMAAGLPLPKQIVGHGWWLMNDAKMSKSLGNVVRPESYTKVFGVDAFRYFCLREMTLGARRQLQRRGVPHAVQRRSRERSRQPREPGDDDGAPGSRGGRPRPSPAV